MNRTFAARFTTALLALLGAAAAAGAQTTPLLTPVANTVALYQMNEGSGTTTADTSGAATLHPGTFNGGTPAWVTGTNGKALDFSPVSAALRVSPSVPVGATWTIQAWLLFPLPASPSGTRTLIRNGSSHHHVLVKSDGELCCFIDGFKGSGYNVNGLNGWHLLSAVGSGGTTTFYIDAAQAGMPAPGQETGPVNDIGNVIGDGGNQNWGTIDCLRILNVARSAADIANDARLDPSTPATLKQIDPKTALEIIAGQALAKPSVKFQGTATSPSGAMVGLVVEIQPVAKAFNGDNGAVGALVASGTPATVTISGLAFSTSFHWRVKAIDDLGHSSGWASYGGNAETATDFSSPPPGPPPSLTSAGQYSPSTNAPVATGASLVDDEGIRLAATPVDPGNDDVKLEAEVVAEGSPFSGSPTASTPLVPSGTPLSVEVALAPGRYVWQVRGVNIWGTAGPWTAGGGNPDVVIVGIGSQGRSMGDFMASPGCGASAAAIGMPLAALAIAALVLRRRD